MATDDEEQLHYHLN